jgi:uncharacterized phage protein gp47/JayE
MASPAVADANYPSPSQTLQWILDAIVFGYTSEGLSAPNVSPGSDHYRRAEAFNDQLSIAIANNQISAAAANPLTATGSDLQTLAAIFGVQPRPASPATGYVTLVVTSGTVNLPSGFAGQINGQLYTTNATGLALPNGATVAITASAAGTSGDQAAGASLVWSSAAIGNLGPTALVTSAGISGGENADDDDTLRARLLAKLSAPPVGGNSSSVQGWAEGSSAAIEAAYVFAAARGNGALDVAVTAVGGTRQVSSALFASIKAQIAAQMPGFCDINLTTVTPQYVDVILTALLPLPQTAGGSGGGWLDAAPWPAEICKITAYNSGTGVATLNSVAAPSVGSSIGVWDPTYLDPTTEIPVGIMREYSVATVGGSAGAWTFTVQSGWQASPLNQYVSADAESLVSYATTFAQALAILGPGEKTGFLELLPRAARFPATDSGTAPPGLTSRTYESVNSTYPEIAVSYAATYTAGTSTPQTTPSVPATTADPPGILVLNSLAFIYG